MTQMATLFESPVVSVSVSVVSVLVVLAKTGGLSCRTSRPATRARMMIFCGCMMNNSTILLGGFEFLFGYFLPTK